MNPISRRDFVAGGGALLSTVAMGQNGLDPKLETLKIGTNCSERRFGWQSEYSVWSFAAPLPSGF